MSCRCRASRPRAPRRPGPVPWPPCTLPATSLGSGGCAACSHCTHRARRAASGRHPPGRPRPSPPLPGPLFTTRFLFASQNAAEGDLPRSSAIERHDPLVSSAACIACLSALVSLQCFFGPAMRSSSHRMGRPYAPRAREILRLIWTCSLQSANTTWGVRMKLLINPEGGFHKQMWRIVHIFD